MIRFRVKIKIVDDDDDDDPAQTPTFPVRFLPSKTRNSPIFT